MNTLNSSQSKGACGKAAFYRQKRFNLYTEKIFNESDELPGCVVCGENVNNLRNADDTALLAESESALQIIIIIIIYHIYIALLSYKVRSKVLNKTLNARYLQ